MGSCQKKKKKRAISKINNNGSSCSIQQHPQNVVENEEEKEEDRLSSLPDSLIVSILSLLPIHSAAATSAAATSALSRRWRHLWTHTTHLSLHYPYHKPFKSVVTLINHIFSQLKSPKIDTFDLYLKVDPSANQVSSGIMVPWIHHICRCNPEVFKVNFGDFDTIYKTSFEIPNCLFETQSLVQLELLANLEFDFLHDKSRMLSFKLPNLKKLTLNLSDAHIPLINGPLLKACPLLQDLYLGLDFTENDRIVDISTPNLKRLRLCVMGDEVEDCRLVIDAPNLEMFHCEGDLTFYDFVNNLSNLQEAEISIMENSFVDDNDMIKIPGLIQGIRSVRSLVLQDSSIFLLDSINRLDALPMFRNLIYLSFSYNIDPFGCINKLPKCFLSGNLKRVDVQDVFPDDVEIKMMKHILSNATVLEKLRVFVCRNISFQEQDQIEYKACKELFKHSKNSVNCQIEFYGVTINASSKDFRDGVLTYQTLDQVKHVILRGNQRV